MKKIIALLLMLGAVSVSAAENYSLYVNDVLVDASDPIVVEDKEILLPFRTILEALGASVEWSAETGEITVGHHQQKYRCFSRQEDESGKKYFYAEHINSGEDVFFLHVSEGDEYRIINDRTYLPQTVAWYFFEALGCSVETKNKVVSIKQLDRYPFSADGLWGYKDSKGNVVVEPKYYVVGAFVEDRALVMGKGGYGFIDESGKEVIPCQYVNAFEFCNGFAAVSLGEHMHDDRWTYIDKDGNRLFDKEFVLVTNFSEGYAAVLKEGYGYPVPPEYDIPKKWSYIDETGEFVTEQSFEEAYPFDGGYAIVKKDGKWGVIDNRFDVVVPFVYDEMRECAESGNGKVFYAQKDGEWRYIPAYGTTSYTTEVFDIAVYYLNYANRLSGEYVMVSVKNGEEGENYTYEWSCSEGSIQEIYYGNDAVWVRPDKDVDYTETAHWGTGDKYNKSEDLVCVTVRITSGENEYIIQDVYVEIGPVPHGSMP